MMFCMTMTAPEPGPNAVLDNCIIRIAAGEQEALAQFYALTHSAVYGFALSIVKNPHDAEDLVHDAYLQVWHGAAAYRSRGKPMAWLMTIVRNLAMDHFRRSEKAESLTWEDWHSRFADEPSVTHEDRMTLAGLLTALSDEERQIVTLHALTGLKHREIAGLLQLPLPTVLSKYNRSLKKLKLAWKEAE